MTARKIDYGNNATPQSTLPNGPTYPQGVGPMGVDLSTLTDLPNDLRQRTIAALTDFETALTTSDPALSAKASAALTVIYSEVQHIRANEMTTKIFAGIPRAHGSRGIMDALAKRAGVGGA
jgi:hypothetical protein